MGWLALFSFIIQLRSYLSCDFKYFCELVIRVICFVLVERMRYPLFLRYLVSRRAGRAYVVSFFHCSFQLFLYCSNFGRHFRRRKHAIALKAFSCGGLSVIFVYDFQDPAHSNGEGEVRGFIFPVVRRLRRDQYEDRVLGMMFSFFQFCHTGIARSLFFRSVRFVKGGKIGYRLRPVVGSVCAARVIVRVSTVLPMDGNAIPRCLFKGLARDPASSLGLITDRFHRRPLQRFFMRAPICRTFRVK